MELQPPLDPRRQAMLAPNISWLGSVTYIHLVVERSCPSIADLMCVSVLSCSRVVSFFVHPTAILPLSYVEGCCVGIAGQEALSP